MLQEDFSVGIAQNNHAFSIRYSKSNHEINPSEVVAACIAFLERGLPTKLHGSFKNDLAEFLGSDNLEIAIRDSNRFLASNDQNWDGIIKGSENINPARSFWRDNLSTIKLDHITLNSIFYPEIAFGQLVADFPKGKVSKEQQVDFYNPLLDLVIEIDGSQHQEKKQAARDNARDEFLKNHKLKSLRLPVSSILNNSEELSHTLTEIAKRAQNSKINERVATLASHPDLVKVIAAIRFQRMILALIQASILPLDPSKWQFEIFCEDFDSNAVFKLAASDLIKTINIFSSVLTDHVFEKFDVSSMFNASHAKIKIDFATCSVFDAAPLNDDIIYVRNNPLIFDYLEDLKALSDYSKAHLNFGKNLDKQAFDKNRFELLLQHCLGFDQFRAGQLEIISGALNNSTMLGLLPTGAGKSLTFQFPSIIQNGCTVVVCPITALVRDHVLELENFGFKRRAAFINKDIVGKKREHIHRRLQRGKLQYLFVSPEQFQSTAFRTFVKSACEDQLITRFVIDEAHCLSEWGHDFRISYLTLPLTLKRIGPKVPILCLTATASVNVMRELQIEFDISDENVVYTMDQSRPELSFDVKITSDKDASLKEILEKKIENDLVDEGKAALIFFPTVNGKHGAFEKLKLIRRTLGSEKVGLFTGGEPKGWSSAVEEKYDARFKLAKAGIGEKDLFDSYKEKVQKLFKNNELAVIVATKSFGMGVNKPNIRTAIHYGLPSSIEALYQEAGRAGRDGLSADCISLINLSKKMDNVISNLTSSYEDLEDWEKNKKILKDDISTQIFFLLSSALSNSDEVEKCIALLKQLRSLGQSPSLIGVRGTFGYNDKSNAQKTIYRLFQLGIIKDWTVEDHFAAIYNVEWQDLKPSTLSQNFLDMVKKYEASEADYENKINEINNMKELLDLDVGGEAHTITSLILWNKLTFFRYRRQSLLHLCQAYKDFSKDNPNKFKKLLDAYFEISKNTHSLLDAITANPDRVVELVWNVFTSGGKTITEKRLDEVGGAITRFSESYPDSMALDLAFSIKNGIKVEFYEELPKEVEDRFIRFIKRVKKLTEEVSNQIFKELYSKINITGENALSRILLEELDEETFANWAMQKYSHKGPFVYLLGKLNTSLEKRL